MISVHCAGDHTKCCEDDCSKTGQKEDNFNLSTAFLFELSNIIVGCLTDHTASIMKYQTTNLAESFMCLTSVFNFFVNGVSLALNGEKNG